jgi:hypothetical protein
MFHKFSKQIRNNVPIIKLNPVSRRSPYSIKQRVSHGFIKNIPSKLSELPPQTEQPIITDPPTAEISIAECDMVQAVVPQQYQTANVYSMDAIFAGERVFMSHLGLDLGTRNVVLSFVEKDGKIGFISEVNGYWPFERVTPFIKNMLDDPNKVRSDGTKRPARWIELNGQAIILGKDAEEFAYAKNDFLRRPMAEGGVAADEEAMTILSTIVTGLLDAAENEIGKFGNEVKLCFCTTAKAVNKDINIDYHKRVVDVILDNYESEATISRDTIKESHAIVLDCSDDGTGIGISWGAGTVTISYVKYGMEVFSFCWVGSGDWIDTQVAMRHGFEPDRIKRKSKETPTTVAKKKISIDLTPGKEPEDRLAMDIILHYDSLINNVIKGIIEGFEEHENEARIEDGINIYMAGGTACPPGFVDRVEKTISEIDVPFDINSVILADNPLFTVARGCLKAAQMF